MAIARNSSDYFDLNAGSVGGPTAVAGGTAAVTTVTIINDKRLSLIKRLLWFTIIIGCSCYCFYYLCISVLDFVQFDTRVAINVEIMQELSKILPGITICTPSLTSLRNLKCADDVEQLQANDSLTQDEKDRLANELISREIEQRFGRSTPLYQYFDRNKRLSSSQQLIDTVLCDRMTWRKQKSKEDDVKYSLPNTCNNVFKVRTIDQDAGACFTLFHWSAVYALMKGASVNRSSGGPGVDDYELPDPEVMDTVHLGSHTPPMFQENGLLRIKLNYNLEPFRRANQSTARTLPYGGKFWIHSNRDIPHISETGYELVAGRVYTVFLSKDIFHLMPPPYRTMCRNYTQEYVARVNERNPVDLSIALSRDSCIDECIAEQAVQQESCKCWPPSLPFRRDNQTNDRKGIHFCDGAKEESCYSDFYNDCFSRCPADCVQEAYEVVIKSKRDNSLDLLPFKVKMSSRKGQKLLTQYRSQKTTVIDVVFMTNEETHHVHEAKVNFVEMSVDVAGLFGLFLGFSFDYFIDLLEYVRNLIRSRRRVSTAAAVNVSNGGSVGVDGDGSAAAAAAGGGDGRQTASVWHLYQQQAAD